MTLFINLIIGQVSSFNINVCYNIDLYFFRSYLIIRPAYSIEIGLRILDSSSFKSEKKIGCRLREVSFFDLFIDDASIFSGSWSNYPFYDSGIVVMSSIEYGLFILKPKLSSEPKLLANLIASVLKIELLTLT